MIIIRYVRTSKNNKFTFGIQMFMYMIINIFLLLRLDELTGNKIKYTLVSLCIFISTILWIISIVVFFKNKKHK